MSRVVADLDVCQGYAMCVINCPEVFGMAESNHVQVLREFNDNDADLVEQAVNSCPTGALSIRD